MPNNNLFSLKRQKELVAINRVLAFLVVIFTFFSGYLLALREEWFVNNPVPISMPTTLQDQSSVGLLIGGGGDTPLFKIFKNARHTREFDDGSISKETLFKLLFAAQGKITSWGERTVPSYKSQFPITLEIYVRNVAGITPGLYWFNPSTQTLEPGQNATKPLFSETSPGLNEAPIIIMANSIKDRAVDMLTWNEAGGIAQNILLAATESNLSTFFVPASSISPAEKSMISSANQEMLWLMPISNIGGI